MLAYLSAILWGVGGGGVLGVGVGWWCVFVGGCGWPRGVGALGSGVRLGPVSLAS